MLTNGQKQGLGTIWDSEAMKFVPAPPTYNSEWGKAFNISENEFSTYTPAQQIAVAESAKNLGYDFSAEPTQINASQGLGGWFKDNKDMIGAGIGAAQLGLGILNYRQNKKALESDLASAKQARQLNEEKAQNKRTIQNKAQSALRFS